MRVIRLAEGPVPADRDFELTWKPAAGEGAVGRAVPRARRQCRLSAGFRHAADRRAGRAEAAAARGRSSSSTTPARWAAPRSCRPRRACIYALGRLQPGDRFNVIRFDHTMDVLFPDAVAGRRRSSRAAPRASSARCRRRRHRDGAGDAGGAERPRRGRSDPCAPGGVPHRRRDRQRAAAVRHHRGACADARACSWSASARRRTAS